MSRFWAMLFAALTAATILTAGIATAGEPAAASPAKKMQVLVVAGGHGYPVKPFRAVFAGYPDMECTFVDEKKWAARPSTTSANGPTTRSCSTTT